MDIDQPPFRTRRAPPYWVGVQTGRCRRGTKHTVEGEATREPAPSHRGIAASRRVRPAYPPRSHLWRHRAASGGIGRHRAQGLGRPEHTRMCCSLVRPRTQSSGTLNPAVQAQCRCLRVAWQRVHGVTYAGSRLDDFEGVGAVASPIPRGANLPGRLGRSVGYNPDNQNSE